ncbi:MAG: TrkH family potassium uptake protein [Bacteroidales bacterium]|nr:TrkH family potassium uptake protein [Bacteroidales bacterium]
MNWRIITRYIGSTLLLLSSLMAISSIIAYCTPGDNSGMILAYSTLLTAATGIFPLLFVRRGSHKLNFKEGNTIVVGAWVAACLFGMLPFLLYGDEFSTVNALFESVSGFTTTGASILTDVESLPRGLQFWRISTAWVGGIGIITLFSMIMIGNLNKSTLSGAEISEIARRSFSVEKKTSLTQRMLLIYVSLTATTLFALKLTGMEWFDSLTNAMSACSTCGFCIKNTSIAFYANPAAEIVLTIAMTLSALNFGILFLAFVRKSPFYIWKSETARVFLTLIAMAVVGVTVNLLLIGNYESVWTAFRDAAFQVASLSTTTGFATQDTTLWPRFSIAILLLCSFFCGCTGSTSGGIKIDRAILAFKGISRRTSLAVSPHMVKNIRIDNRIRPDSTVNDAFIYIFCYLLIVIVFAAVNFAAGLDFTTGVTASVAFIGNVGPGFGDVGSMSNYSEFPVFLKYTGIVEMIIGRLEIFPVLYVFKSMRSYIR